MTKLEVCQAREFVHSLAICAADEITISGLPLYSSILPLIVTALSVRGRRGRRAATPDPLTLRAPMVGDGARGIAFVEAALNSHSEGGCWLEFQPQI